jgi:hypothetical protein
VSLHDGPEQCLTNACDWCVLLPGSRPVPLKPTGGWSKYLQSMNDSSPTSPPTPPAATIAPTPTSS